MQQSTGQIAEAADGSLWKYAAPEVIQVITPSGDPAAGVSYGEPITMHNGDDLPVGTWELLSGTLQAIGGPTVVRQITIV